MPKKDCKTVFIFNFIGISYLGYNKVRMSLCKKVPSNYLFFISRHKTCMCPKYNINGNIL